MLQEVNILLVHCVIKSNELNDLIELVCKSSCGLTGIHRQTVVMIMDYYRWGARRQQRASECAGQYNCMYSMCQPAHLHAFYLIDYYLWLTWGEHEGRKWGFRVKQCPGLKEADTLALIINMVLGFSFNSACTVYLSHFSPSGSNCTAWVGVLVECVR